MTSCAYIEDLVRSQAGSRVVMEKESSKVRGTAKEIQGFWFVLQHPTH